MLTQCQPSLKKKKTKSEPWLSIGGFSPPCLQNSHSRSCQKYWPDHSLSTQHMLQLLDLDNDLWVMSGPHTRQGGNWVVSAKVEEIKPKCICYQLRSDSRCTYLTVSITVKGHKWVLRSWHPKIQNHLRFLYLSTMSFVLILLLNLSFDVFKESVAKSCSETYIPNTDLGNNNLYVKICSSTER